jgi:signal peptidase II
MKLRDLVLPAVACVVLAADQASKAWVTANIPVNGSFEVVPLLKSWFVITHITNAGAAFGLFPQLSLVFTFIALGVSLVIVFYHRSLPPGQWLVRLSLGLQLGGALGNLIDRLRYGYVVDLLYVSLLPVFNIADVAIVAGVALLMLHLLRTPSKPEPAPVPNPADPPEEGQSPDRSL